MSDLDSLRLNLLQTIQIQSSAETAFSCLIRRISSESSTPDNRPLPLILETWPGGRWYRDLGQNSGHLWGHVQVIRPPFLLEIQGPMFMSYPVAGHIQFRITELAEGVELSILHRALGEISDDHRQGVVIGWAKVLSDVKAEAETEDE